MMGSRTNRNNKSPRDIMPRHCCSSPQGAKYITVTQDKSPSGIAEVCDQYLSWPSENQESGASDHEKKSH